MGLPLRGRRRAFGRLGLSCPSYAAIQEVDLRVFIGYAQEDVRCLVSRLLPEAEADRPYRWCLV